MLRHCGLWAMARLQVWRSGKQHAAEHLQKLCSACVAHMFSAPWIALQASPLADKLVFGKVKQRMGGCVRVIISGAAPLAPHVSPASYLLIL